MGNRAQATKDKLYTAALELIGDKGYEDTTVDDIAERAGLTKGTVYYHFESKAELVTAMIRDRSGTLTRRCHAIEETHRDDPRLALALLIAAMLDFHAENSRYNQLILAELWRSERVWHPALADVRTQLVESICRVTKRGVEAGVFRPELEPDFAGYALLGMTTFCALDLKTFDPEQDQRKLLERIMAFVSVGICTTPPSDPAKSA